MPKRTMTGLAAALAAVVVFVGAACPAAEIDQQQMMAAYAEAGRVTEDHALLARMAGAWKTTSLAWMDPAAPPMESPGTNVGEMIMDGRFVKVDYRSTWVGGPMQGLGLFGYDNLKEEYCGLWLDSMSTSMMTCAGQYDPATRQLVLHGSFIDAPTGKEMNARLVYTFASEDRYVFELFSPGPDGKEMRWVEITYVRQ